MNCPKCGMEMVVTDVDKQDVKRACPVCDLGLVKKQTAPKMAEKEPEVTKPFQFKSKRK